ETSRSGYARAPRRERVRRGGGAPRTLNNVIRLIAVDIDGTLLDSRGQLPDVHRDAVVHAVARGIEIALGTGRSFPFARPIAALLPVPLTLVCNNGALVKDATGASHMRFLLPRRTARAVLLDTQAWEDSVALIFDRPIRGTGGPGDDVENVRQVVFDRMDWSHPNRRGYFEKNRSFIEKASSPLVDLLTEDPVQIMFNGSVAPMRALAAALAAMTPAGRFSVAVTEYEHRDFALLDVNAPGCSKGATLAKWAEARGLTRDAVMAVGDNLNDVEMLDYAGTAVVMANASDMLKSRGYLLTD